MKIAVGDTVGTHGMILREFCGRNKNSEQMAIFECGYCQNLTHIKLVSNVKKDDTKSCGCLRSLVAQERCPQGRNTHRHIHHNKHRNFYLVQMTIVGVKHYIGIYPSLELAREARNNYYKTLRDKCTINN